MERKCFREFFKGSNRVNFRKLCKNEPFILHMAVSGSDVLECFEEVPVKKKATQCPGNIFTLKIKSFFFFLGDYNLELHCFFM